MISLFFLFNEVCTLIFCKVLHKLLHFLCFLMFIDEYVFGNIR